MTQSIDFSRLSLQDALDLAILIEEEARDRYEEFVHQLETHHTVEAAAFFRSMAANEARHGLELNERRRALFQDAPRRVSRALLWDVEAPEYDQARVFMSARRAMEVALESEIKAHRFFLGALQYVTDPAVRSLFEDLCREEEHHQQLVRAELAKLPDGPDIDADAFADDPVAH